MGSAGVGAGFLRAENISKTVDGFALQNYTMKDLVVVQTSSSWQETYYQETAADLTASGTGNDVKGIPRLAAFPQGNVTWQKKSAYHVKHGMEVNISHEDMISNDIDVVARHLLRIARAVVKSVDEEIWLTLVEANSAGVPTPVLINSHVIAAGNEWDSATIANRDPIQDILDAKVLIAEDNYNPEGATLVLNPKDYANLLGNANIRNAGQFYTDSVTKNGNVGSLLGLKVKVSNSVTADYAAIVIPREAGTWQALEPLKTITKVDEGIGITIRSWEIGVTQLKNPEAVCLISNTAA